ncbi:MAG: Mur ligase family protein [Patescibacteria group bacterium]
MKSEKYSKYYKAVHYLESLNNIAGSYQKANLTAHPHPEMYLERMQDFLDRIGNPEKSFKYIHITGTSGKGSVSSLIHSALVKNKKKAGLFTSPFVTSTIEKIVVGNKYIDPTVFADLVEYLKPHIDTSTVSDRHGMPSYFELILAIALLYFKKEKCEYVVLEVGLGGRYDATNIIKNPLVTAITNISLDHTQVLGNTTEKIAYDKAGIIKKGSHFFTTEEDGVLLSIFKNECSKVGAIYNALNVAGLDYIEKNKLLANTICKYLNIGEVSKPSPLPARFEIVEKNPLVIIDGAHNVSKIETTIQNLEKLSYNKLSVVISISSDKNWQSIMDMLLSKVDTLYVTKFSNTVRQCVNPKLIVDYAKSKGFSLERIYLHNDPIQAFNKARKNMGKKDALLVVGSFYLAGDIRALYCPEEQILKQRSSKI